MDLETSECKNVDRTAVRVPGEVVSTHGGR